MLELTPLFSLLTPLFSLELATLNWVFWFNHQRLLGSIGYIPPAEAEAQYYRQLANSDSASVT